MSVVTVLLLSIRAVAPGQVPPPNAAETMSVALRAEREAILSAEAREGAVLADRLSREGRSKEAGLVREDLARDRPSPRGPTVFRPIPDVVPRPGDDGRPSEWRAVRDASAAKLEALALRALKSEPPRAALASDCLHLAVARRPTDAAFRLLGYVPHEKGWATPFAVQQLKEGLVRHAVFGWVKQDWVPHLDAGELPAPVVVGRPTRWLPTAEADALRGEWGKGWQINTEHFSIAANVPLAEAIRFGDRLEALYDLFQWMMADLVGPEASVLQLARSPKLAPSLPRKRHKVFYFAEKEQYVAHLTPVQGPAVQASLGTYIPPRLSRPKGNSASYFFRDPGGQLDVVSTLYHEVSHQLLFELAGKDGYDDGRPNFWIFEGLGTYFETVAPRPDGTIEVGGLVGPRFEQARVRLLKNREFVPLARFTGYNKPMFNETADGDVYLHYAQAMALTLFLMQGEGGRHREGFLDHARDVYKGRTSKSLEDRLGVGLTPLTREFLLFLAPPAR